MACFLAPMAEAIVVTVVKKAMEKREKKEMEKGGGAQMALPARTGLKFSRKLGWLSSMLWGGVLLLAFEHIWHGELVPWPPFLTAMNNPAEAGMMLQEIATIGAGMAVFVTIVWGVMALIADKKARSVQGKTNAGIKTEA